jgi:PAS domain S-box-containing protein
MRRPETKSDADLFVGCGTYEWHVAENRVIWSEGLLDLYGVTRAPDAEEGFTSLVHPDDRLRVEAETSSFMESGDRYQHEFRILRPDGDIRYIHDRGEIERGSDGRVRVLRGLNIDVTAQRRAQAAELDALMNDAKGIGFYLHDVAQGRSRWSAEMFRLLDYPYRDIVDPDVATQERVHEDDQRRLRDLQKKVSRRLGPYEIEYRVRLADGRIRWVRDRGEALGPISPATGSIWQVRGTLTDITEIKNAAPATPAGSETFRQVIERAPWGIWVIDADFRLIQHSEAAAKVLPGADSLIGRDFGEILRIIWPEPFASAAIAQFRHTLETGEPFHSSDTRERRADRRVTEIYEWKLEQIRLPDGRPGVVCYFYDLTDRVLQEEALRENEERLQLAYEATGIGAWDLNLATGDAVWTPQLYRLLGLDPTHPANAELIYAHVHPDDLPDLKTSLAKSIETGEVFESGFRIRRSDNGEIRHLAARGRIVEQQAGVPTRMIGVNYDVTDRRRMERKIRESEKELRLLLDNAVALIGVLQPDGTLREANATALAAGGLSRDDVIGKLFWETFWWSYDPEVAAKLRAAVDRARSGEAVRYDAVVRMKGDTRMTIDFLLSPIRDEQGQVRRIVASAFDITDREMALERVRLLMREINHRSKNTLALVQAIARQIWRTKPDDFFDRFASRLRSLASSQDLLVNGEVDGAFLEDVVRTQLAHFGDLLGQRIHLAGPRLGVTSEAAQAIGMAMHELATNAGKYGALSTQQGEILVSWTREDGQISILWTERGGPPVEPPLRTGFGSVVLDTIVRGTLSGSVETEYPREGLRWSLSCSDRFVLP